MFASKFVRSPDRSSVKFVKALSSAYLTCIVCVTTIAISNAVINLAHQSPVHLLQVKEGARGGTGFKVCCLFGINFYVASMSNDVMTHEVCVPAWSARSVNKSDQAFFEQKVGVHSIMMHIPEHIRRPTLLDVQLTFISCSMGAKERDALGNQLCPSGRFCPLWGIKGCWLLMLDSSFQNQEDE